MLEPPSAPADPKIVFPSTPSRGVNLVGRLGLLCASAIAVLVLLAFLFQSHKKKTEADGLRVAKAERRDFIRSLRFHGTVEASQSFTVAAPRLAGPGLGTLVITRLVASGAAVKKGDLLVEFDRQNQIRTALDKRAEYLDLLEQIKKKRADNDAARARDETELTKAEGALEAARLDMRKNEVLSRIDAEKNQQSLDEAEAQLKQLRETFELKRAAAQADVKVLEIQSDRSKNAMRHARQNSEKMAIRSFLEGLVVLNSIWKGNQMAEVQEGDEVRAGVPFLQVVNPSTMQVRARLNQADVLDLHTGQPVSVRLDAYPELVLPGKLEQLGAIGVTSGMSQRVRYFMGIFSIRGTDSKLMPDLSAAVDVELDRRPQALIVPRDALLEDGQSSYVRVRGGASSSKRPVKLGPVNDHEAVVEAGLEAGEIVLCDPMAPETPQ